jgi:hypothetical protein
MKGNVGMELNFWWQVYNQLLPQVGTTTTNPSWVLY